MATRKAPKKVAEALAPAPTSRNLEDYTVMLTRVEGGYWQGQLKELPGVISCSHGWSRLHTRMQDALEQYQRSCLDRADA